MDAFITNYDQPNRVWFNDKTGIFTDSGQNLNASYSQRVALGDLDGDGFLDAFVSNHKGQPDKVWLNDGKGYFHSGQSIGNSNSYSVALGDLDGDNDLDAFVSVWKGYNKVWLNQSNQSDSDGDDKFHGIDNHPTVENPNQTDSDSDSDSDTVIESNDVSKCIPVIYSATDKRVTFDSIVIELYNPITDEPNGQFAVFTGGDMSLVTLSGFSNFTYQGGKPVYVEQIAEASNNCYPTYSFQQKTIYFPKVKIPLMAILPNWKTVEGPSACYQAWLKEANTQAQAFILTQVNEVACQ